MPGHFAPITVIAMTGKYSHCEPPKVAWQSPSSNGYPQTATGSISEGDRHVSPLLAMTVFFMGSMTWCLHFYGNDRVEETSIHRLCTPCRRISYIHQNIGVLPLQLFGFDAIVIVTIKCGKICFTEKNQGKIPENGKN